MLEYKQGCVQCGGVRVYGSTLCGHCLSVCCSERLSEIDKLKREKEEIQRKLTRASEIGNKLIDTIAENQRYIEGLRSQTSVVILSLN